MSEVSEQPHPQTVETNGWAIASLILSIIGAGIGSILAVIFGRKAIREIDASGGTQTGRGIAKAGIIIGWIGIAFTVLVLVGVVIALAASGSSDTGY
jgi:uncharacterized protein DUF4190